MFELYLDTADFGQIARFGASLPVHGITTNPSILAGSDIGLAELLPKVAEILGDKAVIHVQVVGENADSMVREALHLQELPYRIVVKVPATEVGLIAIKRMKTHNIPVLATAIYSVQQGFLAALCGADYLAPYVNRIDALGANGTGVVADLQSLLDRHRLGSKLLPASFKNTQQVLEVLKAGVGAITLPPAIAAELFAHPAVQPAVNRFTQDWQAVFERKLSFES
ncbi:transaldolase family protein [Methylomicrobium sp. RS1]|jgi:TalC/MipB family fructose-6-phosphate aldolase|uniref:transaldolase family protein n=1 Tax=Candidatus Methylomicrobium oryzae TaxID=2802053 RepID=UPI001920B6BA|nr:transaldolase family protein [Methylomicrobium sp. RS1]MBL1264715.1 fructose-6-phosphate aldolase [Methylomicrobium sp. RS1]